MTADEDDREERDPARDGLREGDPARRPRSKWIGEERVERMRYGGEEKGETPARLSRGLRKARQRERYGGEERRASPARQRRGLRKERHTERDTAERRGGRVRRDLTGESGETCQAEGRERRGRIRFSFFFL